MGVLLDLLLGGPGAPVGVSALGFVLIRAAVVANRRYLVGVPFLFQWIGFCLLTLGYVFIVWIFTAIWTWTAIDPVPAVIQYIVVVVIYPLLAPLLARVRPRDPLNVPEPSRGTAQPGRDHVMMRYRKGDGERSGLFTRRALLLGGAQAVLLSALVGRLYQLQVLETAALRHAGRGEPHQSPPAAAVARADLRPHRPAARRQPQQLPRHGDVGPRPRRGDAGRAARPDPQPRRGREEPPAARAAPQPQRPARGGARESRLGGGGAARVQRARPAGRVHRSRPDARLSRRRADEPHHRLYRPRLGRGPRRPRRSGAAARHHALRQEGRGAFARGRSARPRRRRPGRGQCRRPRRARARPHRGPARLECAAHHRSRPAALRRRAHEGAPERARSW